MLQQLNLGTEGFEQLHGWRDEVIGRFQDGPHAALFEVNQFPIDGDHGITQILTNQELHPDGTRTLRVPRLAVVIHDFKRGHMVDDAQPQIIAGVSETVPADVVFGGLEVAKTPVRCRTFVDSMGGHIILRRHKPQLEQSGQGDNTVYDEYDGLNRVELPFAQDDPTLSYHDLSEALGILGDEIDTHLRRFVPLD